MQEQTLKFKVNMIEGLVNNDTIEVEGTLKKSGAQSYGNGTCVVIRTFLNGREGEPRLIDTRYEIGITKHFEEFMIEELSAYYGKNARSVEKVTA